MMGESPQRPASFQARPLVVVMLDISPLVFRAEQLMVPVGGWSTLYMASMRPLSGMPRSAASEYILRIGSGCSWIALLSRGTGGVQFGSAIPGPHQSWLE